MKLQSTVNSLTLRKYNAWAEETSRSPGKIFFVSKIIG
ncbi:hypothetical protein SAMN05421821_115103 [Mucilaginibacter lappiensis]|uniref:Uncharacterized protein n=1 Tax=Mucilaginibacter lappiensis TaxID=354630 RepID=A0A1N7EUT4_9SPHI|nr:hypothetical protein [Mucilaginibacter lappiensis]MBB6126484.1 hypothetical protein [Mucilaginibacter lappiensis]SIR91715.1 hypothetical protein SAMN05421821_115103 [Mucilaginibacter lappiensis]